MSCKIHALKIISSPHERYRLWESYHCLMQETVFWDDITSCKIQAFRIILPYGRYRLAFEIIFDLTQDKGFWNHITSCKIQALRIILPYARYSLALEIILQPHIWALSLENLSLGFLTKPVSNQYPQLQRLARKLKCHL